MKLLLSYFHFRDVEIIKELHAAGVELMIDSGAFGAFKAGKKLDVEEYGDFLQEIAGCYDAAFTLDSIGNPEQSAKNHARLRARGLTPLPVWQGFDADFSQIDQFLDGETYVAMGGLVKGASTARTPEFNEKRVTSFLRAVNGRAHVHLLGYAAPGKVARFRPYSCDSSSVSRSIRFGCDFELFDEKGNRTVYKRGSKICVDLIDLCQRITRRQDYDIRSVMRRERTPGELWTPARELTWASFATLSKACWDKYKTKMYLVGCLPDDIHLAKELCKRGL